MRKGQYQLLIGLIILTALVVSATVIYYVPIKFNPQIKNVTTTTSSSITTTTILLITSSTAYSSSTTQPTTSTSSSTTTTFLSTTSTTTSSTTTSTYTTTTISPISLTSSFYGTVINKSDYDYGPTIMKDGNIYKMWWCGNPPTGEAGDHIYYANSSDGYHWSTPQVVLKPTPNSYDGRHTCDPTVVKVGSTYYMYYTAINGTQSNAMFLATSTDGVTWVKHPTNSAPEPILTSEVDWKTIGYSHGYGVGESSVIYLNGRFYQFYLNSTSTFGSYGLMLAFSDDGEHYTVANNNQPVFATPKVSGWAMAANVDVKFIDKLGMFFLVIATDNMQGGIFWSVSNDSFSWLPLNTSRTIVPPYTGICSHNPGLLGDVYGHSDLATIVYYGAGVKTSASDCWNPATWDIDATNVNLTKQ